MNPLIYWLIALAAYCFFTYQAVLTGGIQRAVGRAEKISRGGERIEPWFLMWLGLGAAWPISIPAWLVIRAAMLKRKEEGKN